MTRGIGDLPERLRGPMARPSDLLLHEQELRAYFIELAKATGRRDEQLRLARSVLSLLARPDELLPLESSRALVSPVIRWLMSSGLVEAARPELELLADRQPRIVTGLAPRLQSHPTTPAQETIGATNDDDLEALWLLSGQGDDEWCSESDERDHLMRRWVEIRPSVDDLEVRARADSRLLRFAVEHRRRIPLEFAEALYGDRQVWKSSHLLQLSAERRRPLFEEIGFAACALINARMAELNPAVYLSEPEAPMISSADNVAGISSLRSAQTAQLGEYLLGITQELDSMLERRGPILRATVESLRKSAQNTFALLGVRPWLPVGSEVVYDITRHNAVEQIPDASSARVIRSGLMRSADKSVLVRPVVERSHSVATDAAANSNAKQGISR